MAISDLKVNYESMKQVLIQNGFETMTATSILARINRSEIQVEPYPYIHVPDALDAD